MEKKGKHDKLYIKVNLILRCWQEQQLITWKCQVYVISERPSWVHCGDLPTTLYDQELVSLVNSIKDEMVDKFAVHSFCDI